MIRRITFTNTATGDRPDVIDLAAAVGALTSDQAAVLAAYLRSGQVIVRSGGSPVPDALHPDHPEVADQAYRSDGTWVWPDVLAYYVETYRIGVPADLLTAAHTTGTSRLLQPGEVLSVLYELRARAIAERSLAAA